VAWTTPKTFSAGSVLTAAELNTHLRDNLNETAAAAAVASGDLVYADGANSMGNRLSIGSDFSHVVTDGTDIFWRKPATDVDTASNSATNTSFVGMGTWGFAASVEVTVTTGTAALVLWKARLSNNTAGEKTVLSYAVSGDTTVAANDNHSIRFESNAANDEAEFGGFDFRTGLTAGSNTFAIWGKVTAGTGTIARPEIAVVPF